MQLAELQRTLAASLAGRSPAPAGLDAAAIERTRRALADKRCRALRHLLPRTAAALDRHGDGRHGSDRLSAHCTRYAPGASLYHVDDAWELAARWSARRPAAGAGTACGDEVRRAAHDDLAMLRLRYTRRGPPGSRRIGERRGLVAVWLSTPPRALLIRLPGRHGQVWRVRG